MKFISKAANYCVMLTHSMPAEPLTGRSAVKGLSVRFEGGIANIMDEKMIDMMLKHPKFKIDFILGEAEKDPFLRHNIEPEHSIMNIEYGHVGKQLNPPKPFSTMTAEMQKSISDLARSMAQEMVKDMLPKMAAEMAQTLKGMVAEKASAPTPEIGEPPTGGQPLGTSVSEAPKKTRRASKEKVAE